jgi:hypothetical protein
MQPKYPIFIPSRGRATKCLTAKILQKEGIPFTIVVEPQDYESYEEVFGKDVLLVLLTDNAGVAFVRNWIKYIQPKNGYHWQLDDNIRAFKRRVDNKNVYVPAGELLSEIEDTVDKFSNVGIAAPRYVAFAYSAKDYFSVNKQAASAVLVNNSLPFSWRKGVAEDTDYSMQVLSAGYCTLVFNKLLIDKTPTMKMSGGCTEIEYGNDGRLKRTLGLQEAWPDANFKVNAKTGGARPNRIWSTFTTTPK